MIALEKGTRLEESQCLPNGIIAVDIMRISGWRQLGKFQEKEDCIDQRELFEDGPTSGELRK